MSSLDEFLPLIRGRLPGAPDIILKDAVRDACIEFCRRAHLLTATDSLTVTAEEAAQALSFDDGDVWSVQDLRRGTSALLPANQREFQVRGWDATTGAQRAAAHYQAMQASLGVKNQADQAVTPQEGAPRPPTTNRNM